MSSIALLFPLTRWRTLLAILLLAALTNGVHAEGGCPAGYYPIGAPDGQSGPRGCAPIPEESQSQPEWRPQWAARWGAFATDPAKGILGVSTGITTQWQAELAAISDCQNHGGEQCLLDISFVNSCAVIIQGNKGYYESSSATHDKALRRGMKQCKNGGEIGCHIVYSLCSPPVIVGNQG